MCSELTMNFFISTTVALCFVDVFGSPIPNEGKPSNNPTDRREFHPIDTTPVRPSNTVGSATNKWQAVDVQAFEFVTCSCPKSTGWSSQELEEHKIQYQLSGGPYDCFCTGPNDFFIEVRGPPPKEFEGCACPSSYGWSSQQHHEHQTRTNLSGGVNDCFCHGFYLKDKSIVFPQKPNSPKIHVFHEELGKSTLNIIPKCSCPKQNRWTVKQLKLLRIHTSFSGEPTECFCSNVPDFLNDIIYTLESLNECSCKYCPNPLETGGNECICVDCITNESN